MTEKFGRYGRAGQDKGKSGMRIKPIIFAVLLALSASVALAADFDMHIPGSSGTLFR